MRLASLEAFGFDPQLISALERHYGPELLELQEKAIREHDLFKSRSILVVGPSSSGKTLVGELAAIRAAWQRRRAIYLVPTRALAEEKYQEMSELLRPLGVRVCVSTRERRQWDSALVHGDYDLCVMVFEKLWGLLIHRPALLHGVSTVVVDELQMLGDRERGPKLDLLLTHILSLHPRPQIVGLSAALAGAEMVANWLGASLLRTDQRPVELRRGVVYGGKFHYREHNSGRTSEEVLVDSSRLAGDSPDMVGAEMLAVAEMLARRGERSIVFLRDKRTCIRLAHGLMERLPAHPAERTLGELAQLEESAGSRLLERLLRHGLAFHHADLPWELRDLVERACRRGEIAVLCATATLAQGMNLPLDNVLMDLKKWDDLSIRRGGPGLGLWGGIDMTEILHSEFENMAGRAGRLGLAHPKAPGFGRAMLFAENPFARDVLLRLYVDGTVEPLKAPLGYEGLGEAIGHLVAAGLVTTQAEIERVLGDTFSGTQRTFSSEDVCGALSLLEERSILRCGDDGIQPAPGVGEALAHGVSLATVECMLEWGDEVDGDSLSDLSLLAILAGTPDGARLHVPLSLSEREGSVWSSCLASRLSEEGEHWTGPVGPTQEAEAAAKKALLLHDWIGQESTATIEGRYRTLAGAIGNLSAEFSRLARAARGVIGSKRPAMSALAERLDRLGERLAAGGPQECLHLARLGVQGLSRGWLLELARLDLCGPEEIAGAGLERLGELLPQRLAEELWKRAHEFLARNEGRKEMELFGRAPGREIGGDAPSPLLRLARRRPNEVWVHDKRVAITRKQFDLLLALAQRPGQCVTYNELYDALWGEGLPPEPNQIRYHKNLLLGRLRKGGLSSLAEQLIRTVHGAGLVLEVSAAAVSVT